MCGSKAENVHSLFINIITPLKLTLKSPIHDNCVCDSNIWKPKVLKIKQILKTLLNKYKHYVHVMCYSGCELAQTKVTANHIQGSALFVLTSEKLHFEI